MVWKIEKKLNFVYVVFYIKKLREIFTAFGDFISIWQLLSSIESVVSVKFMQMSVPFLPRSGRLAENALAINFAKDTITVRVTFLFYAHE